MPWGRDEAPVILTFQPSLVTRIRRFFPVDTGALAAGRLGHASRSLGMDFRATIGAHVIRTGRFESTPYTFIAYAYGTARRYREGRLLAETRERCGPFARMVDAVAGMSAHDEVDYRRFAVECHIVDPLPLVPHLREVWIPRSRAELLPRHSPLGSGRIVFYDDALPPRFLE